MRNVAPSMQVLSTADGYLEVFVQGAIGEND